VTQAFVTRGEFNIPDPDQYPVVGGHRGLGGKVFSGTGPAQSLMTVPLYVFGSEIANAFDFHFRDFILRVVMVSLFNSLVGALTGMLLFAWMRRLGVSVRASAALVLIYSFATMAWVYARTFYSEPLLTFWFVLAGYALSAYHDNRALRWMIVAGIVAGLAVLTKVQGLLVLPALGLYFFALELPGVIKGKTSPYPSFVRRGDRDVPLRLRGPPRPFALSQGGNRANLSPARRGVQGLLFP
jgi:hypothetical protein